jgi:peptidoglycan biosynthesis protein MviN/MurJ (putative lipid II flippase)
MRRSPVLALLAAADIAIGFAIQSIVLATVGVGEQTDAYYAGQAPMLVLLAIFQLPLQRAVVAAFAEHDVEVRYPGWPLLLVVLGAMAATVFVLAGLGRFALPLVFPELSEPARATALQVLRVHGAAVAIGTANLVLLSLNHVRGRFVHCELSVAAASLCTATLVLLTVDRLGVMAAAYGQLLKALISGALYLFLLRGQLGWSRPPWRKIWDIVRPLSSAGLLSKMTPLIDRSIASAAPSGSLTVLVFAQTVYGACVAVAERAIIAPRLPALQRSPALGAALSAARLLALAGIVLVVMFAAGAAVLGLIEPVVSAISASKLQLLLICGVLLAGLPIGTLSAQWMAALMVSIGRAKLSARIMAACFIVAVPVKFVAFSLGGIEGLAVAMSCYYLASALSLWLVLQSLARRGSIAA